MCKRIWPKYESYNESSGYLLLDTHGINDGYFFALTGRPDGKRLKLRVEKDGFVLNYDLNVDGKPELFPLQLGDGKYRINLYENIAGTNYALTGSLEVTVVLNYKYAPFLIPNQYVNYNEDSEIIKIADELCYRKSPYNAYSAIKDYLKKYYFYDFIRSVTISNGALPDIERTYTMKMGICQDLSAFMVAMLRSQGIASRLVIGRADNERHAWTVNNVCRQVLRFDPTVAVCGKNKIKTYTVERFY